MYDDEETTSAGFRVTLTPPEEVKSESPERYRLSLETHPEAVIYYDFETGDRYFMPKSRGPALSGAALEAALKEFGQKVSYTGLR